MAESITGHAWIGDEPSWQRLAFRCPCCQYDELQNPYSPNSYEICPQCGIEFGLEPTWNYPAIREAWKRAGKPFWQNDPPDSPVNWQEIWDAD